MMLNHHMNRRSFGRLAVAAAALMLPGRSVAQARLTVATVNYPLAYFAERLATGLADVSFPVPDGIDPSFWRPGIADIAEFQAADLILLNGAGFADWTARTTLPRSRLVNTSVGFEDAFIATETVTHSHGDGGEHSHTGTASYTWLDFDQAAQQAAAIAAGLSRAAPDAADEIYANLAALTDDLEALGATAREIGETASNLPVICSHPRYQYFGRAYGITLDAVDWDVSEPPSPAQWQALASMASDLQAKIFIWEGPATDAARARIESLGLTNADFPPLANRPVQGDFLSAMRASLENLRQAVEQATGG
ncbi:MAG: metal ABC transporter substrate-binding protein [Pseudomonadota bacterium]